MKKITLPLHPPFMMNIVGGVSGKDFYTLHLHLQRYYKGKFYYKMDWYLISMMNIGGGVKEKI